MKTFFLSAMIFIACQAIAQTQKLARPKNPEALMSIDDIRKRSANLLFVKMQEEGTIVCEGKDNEGRDMYTMFFLETNIVHLYMEDVLEFLGEFTSESDEQPNTPSK